MNLDRFKDLMCGPIVVVFTPFDEKGTSIDEEELRKNVRYMIDNGIQNYSGVLIAGGSVGDSFVLSLKERKRLFEIVVEEANGEVPVVCGTNHTSTNIAIELSKFAEEIGADGIMNAPPFYYKTISDKAVYEHYKAISDQINIGIMLYNNPAMLDNDLSVDLLLKLSKLKNVLAIKESTPYRIKYKQVVETLGDKIVVINGAGEDTEPDSYRMGTKGFITAYGNFVPGLCVGIHKEALNNNYQKVEQIIKRFNPLKDIIYRYVNDVGPEQVGRIYKEIAISLGFKLGGTRLPIIPVPQYYKEKIKEAVEKNGFLEYVNNTR